jgi:signal transduction histidine kinase
MSLFSLTERTTSVGTAGERGTGFGLPLAAKFVKFMGGKLRVESGPLTDQSTLCLTVVTASFPTGEPARRPDGMIGATWSSRFMARDGRLGGLKGATHGIPS